MTRNRRAISWKCVPRSSSSVVALSALILLGPATEQPWFRRETLPRVLPLLRCIRSTINTRREDNSSSSINSSSRSVGSSTGRRRRNRPRLSGWASAQQAEAVPGPTTQQHETRYCPSEGALARVRAPEGSRPSEGASCDDVLVEVKNESGMSIAVVWVGTEGEEVRQLSVEPGQTSMARACRGHYWRARSSPDERHQLRLLSELEIPHRARSKEGGDASAVLKNAAAKRINGAGIHHEDLSSEHTLEIETWHVRPCVGYRLPKAVVLTSGIGGMGTFDLSRGSLGRRLSERQESAFREGKHIAGSVEIALEEAFSGKDVAVKLLRRVPCPVCHGQGSVRSVPCDRCGGEGKRVHETQLDSTPATHVSCDHRSRPCFGTDDGGDEDTRRDSARATETNANFTGGGRGGCGCTFDGQGAVGGDAGCRLRQDYHSAGKRGRTRPATMSLTRTADCAKCAGTGRIPLPIGQGGRGGYCTACAGEKFVEDETLLTVSIPPGAEEGHTELVPGMGHIDIADPAENGQGYKRRDREDEEPPTEPDHSAPTSSSSDFSSASTPPPSPGREAKAGDFQLTVNVAPNTRFSRQGGELRTEISISLTEALRGFTRNIPLLDGTVYSMRRTSLTLPGTLLRLPQLGMPLPTSNPVDGSADRSRSTQNTCKDGVDRGVILAGVQSSDDVGVGRGGHRDTEAEETVGIPTAHLGCRRASAEDSNGRRNRGLEEVVQNTDYGDLIVIVSVSLPSGMRDDRSKFIGGYLAGGSEETPTVAGG